MTVDRLIHVDDLLKRLTADMGHFLKLRGSIFVYWGPAFWTFHHQLVAEGSTGAPKGTPWAAGLDATDQVFQQLRSY